MKLFCIRYNRYLYRLPVQAVPIIDIVKNSISSADIVINPIIGTSLLIVKQKNKKDRIVCITRHYSTNTVDSRYYTSS